MSQEKQSLYDSSDKDSILSYARLLLGKSLRDFVDVSEATKFKGKGHFGQALEKYYFGYEPNSNPEPDFPDANLELKTTPLNLKNNNQYSAKERLVLNIINYMTIHDEDFAESSVLKKNASLLIVAYLHDSDAQVWDLLIKIVDIWEIPPEELKIIEDDWNIILNKIKLGKAHELSERDTMFLGAATKGSKGGNLREQPFSSIKAPQRAFSFKTKYISHVLQELMRRQSRRKVNLDSESVVKSIEEYQKDETFEELIRSRLVPYRGLNIDEILDMLNPELRQSVLDMSTRSKHYIARLTAAMLGSSKLKIAEFEKGDICLKAIRLKANGMPKEDMSFPYFKYRELVDETWEESTFRERLNKRFFLVFFQYDEAEELVFQDGYFWAIPHQDLENEVKWVWEETVRRILQGKADQLPKKSENSVSHVRPHARNKLDTNETPNGQHLVKKCFWLNSSYLKEQYERLTKDRLHNI